MASSASKFRNQVAERGSFMISIRNVFAFVVAGCVIGCACLMLGQGAQEGRLLRFPDIYKDKIAFRYGGDLWLASSSRGPPRRLTPHPGRELFPNVSPDRKGQAC